MKCVKKTQSICFCYIITLKKCGSTFKETSCYHSSADRIQERVRIWKIKNWGSQVASWVWKKLPQAIMWKLWGERNNSIFGGQRSDWENVSKEVLLTIWS